MSNASATAATWCGSFCTARSGLPRAAERYERTRHRPARSGPRRAAALRKLGGNQSSLLDRRDSRAHASISTTPRARFSTKSPRRSEQSARRFSCTMRARDCCARSPRSAPTSRRCNRSRSTTTPASPRACFAPQQPLLVRRGRARIAARSARAKRRDALRADHVDVADGTVRRWASSHSRAGARASDSPRATRSSSRRSRRRSARRFRSTAS